MNLNETLGRVLKNIEDPVAGSGSEDDFEGLFDDLDVNSNKLGTTVVRRTEKLVKLLDEWLSGGTGRNCQLWGCGSQPVGCATTKT